MVRVLTYLLLVGLFAFAAIWIADRPGDLVVNWQGYRIETSVMAAAAFVAVVAALTVALWNLMRWILAGPEAFALFRRNRRRAKGYDAVARGVVAVGTGDARMANKEAGEARRLLGKEPLTLVLAAQAAQLSGDGAGAEAAFRAMTERDETKALGLRGLYIEAERRGDRPAARAIAEEAMRETPGTPWAGEALFDFQCAEHDWAGALITLDRLAASRLIDKADSRRKRAVLLTAQAMDGAADPATAVKRAREAHSLAPDFTPAAATAARLLAEQSEHKKAMKIVEQTWSKATHPDLAEVYVHVRPGDSARDKLKRAKSLAERSGDDPEGLIAVARAAMAAREFGQARAALDRLISTRPTARACLLMAELCEIEHADAGRAREWLGRAARAPRDPAWVADGVATEAWAPTSPVTGRLDAFVWKAPVEETRPKLAAEAWLDREAGREMRAISPAPAASPPATVETRPAPPAPVAANDKAPGDGDDGPGDLPRQMPTLLDGPDEARSPARAERGAKTPPRPTATVFPLPRAPDDPGPNASETVDALDDAQNYPASRPNY